MHLRAHLQHTSDSRPLSTPPGARFQGLTFVNTARHTYSGTPPADLPRTSTASRASLRRTLSTPLATASGEPLRHTWGTPLGHTLGPHTPISRSNLLLLKIHKSILGLLTIDLAEEFICNCCERRLEALKDIRGRVLATTRNHAQFHDLLRPIKKHDS